MTTKEQILKSLEELPDDASYEDALRRLYVLYKIELGLKDIEEARTIPHAEVLERIAKWRR